MKQRPFCSICGKPAMVIMWERYICGECVVKWDKMIKEKAFEMFKEEVQ